MLRDPGLGNFRLKQGWLVGAREPSPSGSRGHTGMSMSRQGIARVLIGDGSLGLRGSLDRDLGSVHCLLGMGCGFCVQPST